MSKMWDGPLVEGYAGEYKIIRCMKPGKGRRSQGYYKEGEFFFGKMIDISVCIRCEVRLRLEEKVIRVDEDGISTERRVAKSQLHPEARMRCLWFRRWASENMDGILTLRVQEKQRLNAWLDGGKRRADWLDKNIYKFHNQENVHCPFCVNSVSGIVGDSGCYSYEVEFADFPKLVRHINESHGLVRIIKKGKRGVVRWKVRFNGDETYQENLSKIDIGDGEDLVDLIGEDNEELEIEFRKPKRSIEDLLDMV